MKLENLDIVYLVKDSQVNEELRYSIRSIEQNFPHRYIWLIGGCPNDINIDTWIYVAQNESTKWANTSKLLRSACEDSEVSDNFVLFNDDFFVLNSVHELPYYSDGTLQMRIESIKRKYGKYSKYSLQLQTTLNMLEQHGMPTINYAVHYPMIINKQEMIETFEEFPEGLMWRSLYGNHHNKPIVSQGDCKISNMINVPKEDQIFVSTKDSTFKAGNVGKYIRNKFIIPSKYEL